MHGKAVRARLDAGEAFDEVIRIEVSFMRPQVIAIFEMKEGNKRRSFAAGYLCNPNRRSQVDRET